jgi:integrase
MATVSLVLRQDKRNEKGESPVYFRIIKDRKPKYIASGYRFVDNDWDFDKNCVKPKFRNSVRVNAFLNTKLSQIEAEVIDLERCNKSLTSRNIKEKVNGKKPSDFFQFAYDVVQEYAEQGNFSTRDKNLSIINKLKVFVNESRIDFQDIDIVFLKKYENYLKLTLGNKTNTISTNMRFIRKVFNDGYRQGVIEHSVIPFPRYQIKNEKTNRVFLTEGELSLVESYTCAKYSQLELHRDMFVFSSYTGLRISDVLLLQWKHFSNPIINFQIHKTSTQITIKVPDKGIALMNKYRPEKDNKEAFIFKMLPENIDLSNSYMVDKSISSSTAYVNKSLSYISNSLEIGKHISFHVSRHTFAIRALNKGIPVEKLQKLLGHANIKETMVYVHILDMDLHNAMDVFN